MLNNIMIHRFFKDFKISLPVERSDFLDYYLENFDEYFDLKRKLEIFLQCRNDFNNDEDFYVYRNGIIGKVLDYVQNHEQYQELINTNQLNNSLLTQNLPKNEFFNCNNVNKTFLSIDLTSGNFTALKHWNKDLVMNAEIWKDFIKKFTQYEYFAEAKHLRQSLLGKLNHKRIAKFERILLDQILQFVLDNNNLKLNDIVSYNYDEVIFEVDKDFDENIQIPHDYINDVHVEKFVLKDIKPYNMFVKLGNEIKFKCVSSNLFPQVYKHVMNLPLNSEDMYFVTDNGLLAKYEEGLNFEKES